MLELRLSSPPSKSTYTRISDPRKKILSLFSLYASHPLYNDNKDKLGGVLDIVDGLEHNFKKIKNCEKRISRPLQDQEVNVCDRSFEMSRFNLRPINYRAISEASFAYIGRIGQLVYFFQSNWFGRVVDEADIASCIPTLLALMPIRNKYSAHRQQDAPRKKDDCEDLGFNQFGLMPALSGQIGKPESMHFEYNFSTKQREGLLKIYHPTPVPNVEVFGEKNNLIIFSPTEIHSAIVEETVILLERFFDFNG